jgi:hypothetical protein
MNQISVRVQVTCGLKLKLAPTPTKLWVRCGCTRGSKSSPIPALVVWVPVGFWIVG